MAGMRNARGGLGWMILIVALAVPGVLFYNWWSHLKSDREKALAAKARGRVPDRGVFQSSPNAKLVNPMTPAVSTTAAAAPAALSANAVPAVSAAAEPQEASPAATAEPFSSSAVALPPLKRDPMLSPSDRVHLIEEEEAKRRAAEDLAAMQAAKNNRGKKRPKPAIDPQSMVELQGIVSNPESGYRAIVNNEVVGVGQFIGRTKIKIIKITDLGVTFDYQGKKFSKGVSRD